MAPNDMQVSIGRSHQPPVLCQAAWTVLLELLVCPPTRMPLQCKATLDRDISMHSIDGAFRPRGPRQGPHGATSSWPRMAGSWVNRESKTHKVQVLCALCMLYVYFYKHSLSAMCGFVAVAVTQHTYLHSRKKCFNSGLLHETAVRETAV